MSELYFDGVIIAVFTLLIIGAFHPLVIRAEYRFSKSCWPAFLAAGLFFLGISLKLRDPVPGALTAVTGAVCLWSIRELFEQEERVKKGWWPKNPDRDYEDGQLKNRR